MYSYEQIVTRRCYLELFSSFNCEGDKGLLRNITINNLILSLKLHYSHCKFLMRYHQQSYVTKCDSDAQDHQGKNDNRNAIVSAYYKFHYTVMSFASLIILVETELVFTSFVITTRFPCAQAPFLEGAYCEVTYVLEF
jgi:hypothetical protein